MMIVVTGMELLPVGTLTMWAHFVRLLLYFIWISLLTEYEELLRSCGTQEQVPGSRERH